MRGRVDGIIYNIYIYIYTCIYIYIYTYTCIYIYIYIYDETPKEILLSDPKWCGLEFAK